MNNPQRTTRAFHRWLGLVTGVQLLFWCAGGFVFSTHDIEWVRGNHGRDKSPPATLPADGGLVFSTNPPGGIDASRNGLFVRAYPDTVVAAFRDTVAAVAPRAEVEAGACSELRLWADVGQVAGRDYERPPPGRRRRRLER